MLGRQVASIFATEATLPGVLVVEDRQLLGVISRDRFFEHTGKMFGTEVFLSRPIATMLETIRHAPLVLPATTLISVATQRALERSLDSIYQPIVVEKANGECSLVSVLVLFMAQSHLLTMMHQQRLFTVDNGQNIPDDQAVANFMVFARLNGGFDVKRCYTRHSVRCDHCSQSINYSVVDVVRSFPQLMQGVLIEEGMGTRAYRFYVRHRCGKEIWEVPVQHDANLEYRSQRSARLVEAYA
jgi:hypothetical protein